MWLSRQRGLDYQNFENEIMFCKWKRILQMKALLKMKAHFGKDRTCKVSGCDGDDSVFTGTANNEQDLVVNYLLLPLIV